MWFTDEGLDGLAVHLANDRPQPWVGTLRLALYRADDLLLEQVDVPLEVPAHGDHSADVEGLLGRFLDLSYAYRFGSPSVAVVVATVEDGSALPSQAFHFPLGRPTERHDLQVLTVEEDAGGLLLRSTRLLDTVHVSGVDLPDNDFCLEPGRARRLPGVIGPRTVSALNLH